MNFEEAGRVVDREVAKLGEFLDSKLKPSTRQEMAALLHRASRHLAEMAKRLEGTATTEASSGGEPAKSDQKPGPTGG